MQITELWNTILHEQLKWSLIPVLVALCIHQVTENFWSQPSMVRAHKKAPVAKNPLNRSRHCRNTKDFSCSLCSLTKWASSQHLRKTVASCCEWDTASQLSRPRPWHQDIETKTVTLHQGPETETLAPRYRNWDQDLSKMNLSALESRDLDLEITE